MRSDLATAHPMGGQATYCGDMLIQLGGYFFLISVVFWLWAIFDTIVSDQQTIRVLPKWAWVLVVLLFMELGALAWVVFGRPRRHAAPARARTGGSPGMSADEGSTRPQRRPSSRPIGPDDDPDFLKGLSNQ